MIVNKRFQRLRAKMSLNHQIDPWKFLDLSPIRQTADLIRSIDGLQKGSNLWRSHRSSMSDFPSVTMLLAAASGSIVNNAGASASDAITSVNGMFESLLYGEKATLFKVLSDMLLPAAFLFLMWHLYNAYQEYHRQPNLDHAALVATFIAPLFCIILLSGGGAYAKNATTLVRNFSNNFGANLIQAVGYSQTFNGLSSKSSGLESEPIATELEAKLAECSAVRSNTDVSSGRGVCAMSAISTAVRRMKDEGNNNPRLVDYVSRLQEVANKQLEGERGTSNSNFDLLKMVSGGLPAIAEQMITSILNAMTIVFYWALEIAMLILFLLFPVYLAVGVLNINSVVTWLSQAWALTNAKICFSFVLFVISTLSDSLQGLTFVVPLLMSFFAPFMAFIVAKGSMVSIAEGLTGAAIKMGVGAASGGGKAAVAGVRGASRAASSPGFRRAAAAGARGASRVANSAVVGARGALNSATDRIKRIRSSLNK
jgi:hypothetical protein